MRYISYWIVMVAIGVILATLLMFLAYCIPTGRMRGHVLENADRILKDGDHPEYGGDLSILDGWTDAIMLGTAAYDGDESVIRKAMLNPAEYAVGEKEKVAQVVHALEGGVETEVKDYPRYWHGYLIFIKPLLLIFNVKQLRMLNVALQILLMIVPAILIARRFGKRHILILMTTVLFLSPVSTMMSFQFSDIFYITMIALIILLIFEKKLMTVQAGYIYFLTIGMLVAFFDFLTYPVVSVGIPLIFYTMMSEVGTKEKLTRICVNGVAWCRGYTGMWASKWLISFLLTGHNTIWDALGKVAQRTSDTKDTIYGVETISRLTGLKDNLAYLNKTPLFMFFIALVVVLSVIVIVRKHFTPGENIRLISFAPLLSLILMPLVWYIVMNNHSAVHPFITWRDMSVAATAIIAILCELLVAYEHKV